MRGVPIAYGAPAFRTPPGISLPQLSAYKGQDEIATIVLGLPSEILLLVALIPLTPRITSSDELKHRPISIGSLWV